MEQAVLVDELCGQLWWGATGIWYVGRETDSWSRCTSIM